MKLVIHFIAILVLVSSITQAETIIPGGNVSGTWGMAGSPFIIQGDITIQVPHMLLVEPGVEVIFEGHYRFEVYGILEAIGTVTDSIYFHPQIPEVGWWGIRFFDAPDGSVLDYCIIKDGYASAWGTEEGKGGGIYCDNSRPSITHCTFESCKANGYGGAIHLSNGSDAIITNCRFIANQADQKGGGVNCEGSDPEINNNLFLGNDTQDDGGAIASWSNSNPVITGNIIKDSNVIDSGGGIFCFYSVPLIKDNYILNNGCQDHGGGIYFEESPGTIDGNVISGNYPKGGIWCTNNAHALIINNIVHDNQGGYYGGGGMWVDGSIVTTINNYFVENVGPTGGGIYSGGGYNILYQNNVFARNQATYSHGGGFFFDNWGGEAVRNNTFYQNSASNSGGGIYGYGPDDHLINNIFWDNSASSNPQIGGTWDVTYCDVTGGWTGTGNIDEYPMFVDTTHSDFRLRWDSPCIDSGDPNPLYTDPDGTISDMGALPYDQSMPVRVLLTPHEILNVIPGTGGSIDFTIWVDNIDTTPQTTTIWSDITLPNGTIYGPVIGPVTINLAAGFSGDRLRIQNIPQAAPWGVYRYNIYAEVGSDVSSDYFTFAKTGSAGLDWSTGWENSGEDFDEIAEATQPVIPAGYSLRAYPNPFNPTTAISIQLSAFSHVTLSVYDISGRKVAELIDGYRDAGIHEVTFNASHLASGIYFSRLEAGDFSAIRKMALVK
ncbi:right-handed parallel beta-helix repeat-containing protein [bacterium]|nr:right-handed parallel beta-helix repeat-containing protein [bacterium]